MSAIEAKGSLELPITYRVNPEWAREALSHGEMVALSGMFRRWALYEEANTPEQATKCILWSSDYERLAKWVGPDWQPEVSPDPVPLMKFLAILEIRHSRSIPLDQARALLADG